MRALLVSTLLTAGCLGGLDAPSGGEPPPEEPPVNDFAGAFDIGATLQGEGVRCAWRGLVLQLAVTEDTVVTGTLADPEPEVDNITCWNGDSSATTTVQLPTQQIEGGRIRGTLLVFIIPEQGMEFFGFTSFGGGLEGDVTWQVTPPGGAGATTAAGRWNGAQRLE